MSNKKIIFGVVLLILLAVLGYFMFGANKEVADQNPSQGKLDIAAVCEGALAYMSFPDGESAEKFVSECKEGKYPEVIERYKADMNLGAGAEI